MNLTLECLTIPCLCVFVKCARPSSRSSRTSASNFVPPKHNGGSFLRHLDEDGTCPMHAPRLIGNMYNLQTASEQWQLVLQLQQFLLNRADGPGGQ